MRANRETLLTLDEWAKITGYPEENMAQIGKGLPETGKQCSDVMYQFAKQTDDMLVREEVADAISKAERLFYQATGFWPAPKYIEGEPLEYPDALGYSWRDSMVIPKDGRFKHVNTEAGQIRSVGVLTRSEIEADAAVSYSDADGDGYDDTATITTGAIIPSGALASEIKVYFTATDRANKQQRYWQIRPLDISINTTTNIATITGPKYLFVQPKKQIALNAESLTLTGTTDFVTTVDIWYETIDQEQAGTLIWENVVGCDAPCSSIIQVGCFGIRNAEAGRVTAQPASWDSTNLDWDVVGLTKGRPPDRVVINYLAGYPLQEDGRMNQTLADIITMLACSILPKRACGCSRAQKQIHTWQTFQVEEVQSSKAYLVTSPNQVNSLWGGKYGAVEAWRLTQDFIKWGAVKYG